MKPGLEDLGLKGLATFSFGDSPCTDNFRKGIFFVMMCIFISWDCGDSSNSKLKNFPWHGGH